MSKSTVFVVEDHQSVLDAISALLATSGYRTQCYLSHEAFLSQLNMPEEEEGCILVDLTAPGVNGRQFMRRLRARGCNLPVIAGTFSATDEEIQAWLSIGVFAVLYKPFETGELLETVQNAMNLSLYFLICSSLTSLLQPF
jgi:two-component system, LuxR family, response regulator FixJ